MIAERYDPSDMRTSTIEKLFYRQMHQLTQKTVEARMKSFDLQFSDSWL